MSKFPDRKLASSGQSQRGWSLEKDLQPESSFERLISAVVAPLSRWRHTRLGEGHSFVDKVLCFEEALRHETEEALHKRVQVCRDELMSQGFVSRGKTTNHTAHVFALVREWSHRKLGMLHHENQLLGGWGMLAGKAAEMEVGEGGLFTMLLAACTVALAGIPTHIIVANANQATHGMEWLTPVFDTMGLKVGAVVDGMTLPERQAAYSCDVTFCVIREIVFDYLKDRNHKGKHSGSVQVMMERLHLAPEKSEQCRLQGLAFALVDEIDSVLIDHARTPLILSNPRGNTYEQTVFEQALGLGTQLTSTQDFDIEHSTDSLYITTAGKQHLKKDSETWGGFWAVPHWREGLMLDVLTVLQRLIKDQDYQVVNRQIQIRSERAQQLVSNSKQGQTLKQLLEMKEECPVSGQADTLSQISLQQFFRKYHHLSGLSSSVYDCRAELWSMYRIPVFSLTSVQLSNRQSYPTRIYPNQKAKQEAILKRVQEIVHQGRAILLVTRSAMLALQLQADLEGVGWDSQLLAGGQKDEISRIQQAGESAQITIVSPSFGDSMVFPQSELVKNKGGLHVLVTEPHESHRLDRRWMNRCAASGESGSYEIIASVDDDVMKTFGKTMTGRLLLWCVNKGRWIDPLCLYLAQRKIERKHTQRRRELLYQDEMSEKKMAFTGPKAFTK